jgi:uncharacterized protein (TIGR01777 family)
MRIAIAGGTGFIGEPLAKRLAAGNDVAILTRNPSRVRAGRGIAWNPPEQDVWADVVAAADVVINLAGENIAQRWTRERKARIVSSRIDSTNALIEAMKSAPPRKRTFINASAIGYYGSRGDELLDEASSHGDGFLADLVGTWEAAAQQAETIARLVIIRFGVVLDPHGGALAKMLPPFRFGLGGPIGNGRQWMSWIERDDVVRMIEWAIARDDVRGIYNAVSPEPVRNRDFTRELGRALHRPAIIPIPAFALKLMFGEMATGTVLPSQRVMPARAMAEGFTFEQPQLAQALAHSLTRP